MKSKRVQYTLIVWILLVEVIEIAASLLSGTGFSSFFAVLGFDYLSATSRIAWGAIFTFTVLWLAYRVSKDIFQFSISLRSLSRKQLLGLAILVLWIGSAATTTLQFAVLAAAPLVAPDLEASTYYSPVYYARAVEIFGWYWLDWGTTYYYEDFKTIKSMFIDGVLLLSYEYTFVDNPEAFETAATMAQQQGLKVGIIVFHPYDARSQAAWGLPVNQDHFADFTTNKTWIETTYAAKLTDVVSNGNMLNVTYYAYDDMNFWEAQNLTNAQLFIDITNKITGGKALMLGSYPPEKLVIPSLSIVNWDWYSAPEDINSVRASLKVKPSNNTSLGQFVWLYERTNIDFASLQAVYNELFNASRIEIFAMRYGASGWSNGVGNSILEHPALIEYLTMLNQKVKGLDDPTGSVSLNDYETNNVSVDLSKSIFGDPFSVYENGTAFEYATEYAGSSYFALTNTSIDQEMIEMSFSGNGTNGLGGWFAYRVNLSSPISVDENSTVFLLLRLTPSSDGSAWAYYKVDFLTEENLTYSLIFKFYDVPTNSEWIDKENRISYYFIGSVLDWEFYQFNIGNLFYTSFSREPSSITRVEYAIGASSASDVKACFLLAKVSSNPLEANGLPIENERANVKLDVDHIIEIRGLTISKLFVTLSPSSIETNVNTEWSMLKMSRTESYRWDTSSFSNMTEITMSFNASSNYDKLLLNGIEITSEPKDQQTVVYEIDPKEPHVNLVVTEETDAYLLPLTILLPIIVALSYVLLKVARRISEKSTAKSPARRSSPQRAR